jgi:hypothetical protein
MNIWQIKERKNNRKEKRKKTRGIVDIWSTYLSMLCIRRTVFLNVFLKMISTWSQNPLHHYSQDPAKRILYHIAWQ